MQQDNINSSNNRVDRGWGKMHSTLDVKMPQKKDRKMLFWWVFGIGFLVAVMSIFMFSTLLSDNNHEGNIGLVENNNKETIDDASSLNVTKKEADLIQTTAVNNTIDKSKDTLPEAVSVVSKANISNRKKNQGKNLKIKEKMPLATNPNIVYSNRKSIANNESPEKTSGTIIANSNIENVDSISSSNSNNLINTKTEFKTLSTITLAPSLFSLITDMPIYKIDGPSTFSTLPNLRQQQTTPWSSGVYVSLGADYIHQVSALGSTLALGYNLTKGRFSVGPLLSYTRSTIPKSTSDLYSQSVDADELRLADRPAVMGTNIFGATQELGYINDTLENNALSYISIGLDTRYALSRRINLLLGLGRELHFGSQTLIPITIESALNDLMEPEQPITLNHKNTYFLQTGMAYNINSKWLLGASYRYSSSTLSNIIGDARRSSKISMSLRYSF